MGFPKEYATTILANVFRAGNKIALASAVSADGYTELSGKGYVQYEIKSGDFLIKDGVATTAKHILFGLAEESWGICAGFAVLSGSQAFYLGALEEDKPIGANSVPVFKMYVEDNGQGASEGIKVTLDVVTSASASVVDAT